jgi:transposase
VPRVDVPRVVNDNFWVLCSGSPWRDLPEFYGLRTNCYDRFVRWRRARLWDRNAITVAYDGDIQIMDSTSIRRTSRLSKKLYRQRNQVERFFRRLKDFQRIAARCDKLADNFLAMVKLASMRVWLRAYGSSAS